MELFLSSSATFLCVLEVLYEPSPFHESNLCSAFLLQLPVKKTTCNATELYTSAYMHLHVT